MFWITANLSLPVIENEYEWNVLGHKEQKPQLGGGSLQSKEAMNMTKTLLCYTWRTINFYSSSFMTNWLKNGERYDIFWYIINHLEYLRRSLFLCFSRFFSSLLAYEQLGRKNRDRQTDGHRWTDRETDRGKSTSQESVEIASGKSPFLRP